MTVAGHFADAKPLAAAYREAYLAAGHDLAEMSVAAVVYVHVRPDGAKAREYWFPYRDNYRVFTRALTASKGVTKGLRELYKRLSTEVMVEREGDFCGSPAEIIDKIFWSSNQMGGFDKLITFFDLGGIPRAEAFAAMDLFAEAVMPVVKAELK